MNHQPNAQPLTERDRYCRRIVLASYRCDEGWRQLVGQRINGKVAVSDVPVGEHGKVYLVERHAAGRAELDAIVANYCELARRLGRPPLRCDWVLS